VRIKKYEIAEGKFQKNLEIDDILKKDRESSLGIFGGKMYELVLEITPPMSNTIGERIWVENQQITYLDNGKILFTAMMNGGPELVAWILSMGDTVKIIKPENLKEEIKIKLEKMLKKI
jgi:predicted DNA-binding transcriptional regulator YafY